ncbi:hypothetical protein B296_00054045 [Ensete ventricosum]|uniref:Uncharacterized protein n=1 Tax=Ensete ventricosum TaxID=4639 RepID=A0A426XY82_ENSVE|nr:hypothetical protein B296_00054045 [Ensete ventricosum]
MIGIIFGDHFDDEKKWIEKSKEDLFVLRRGRSCRFIRTRKVGKGVDSDGSSGMAVEKAGGDDSEGGVNRRRWKRGWRDLGCRFEMGASRGESVCAGRGEGGEAGEDVDGDLVREEVVDDEEEGKESGEDAETL